MHSVTDRRLAALLALLATETGPRKVAMARRVGKHPAQISQWLSGYRTISEDTARQIEAAYGRPTGWMDAYPHSGGDVRQDRPASLQHAQTPPKVQWGELGMRSTLPPEFEVELPDQSMAPSAPRGARCIFVTDVACEPGDWVLVRDKDGRHHMRELRQTIPGQWQAHAINPAYLPLDSERDGLTVVAVFDGMRGRRSAR